jgi:hypothetical protein
LEKSATTSSTAANARQDVFRKKGDYQAFVDLIGRASERVRMRLLAYCVMPNHFHLALYDLIQMEFNLAWKHAFDRAAVLGMFKAKSRMFPFLASGTAGCHQGLEFFIAEP